MPDNSKSQEPDPRPGNYYVTAIDGDRWVPLLGPFVNDHRGALDAVEVVRNKACSLDPRAWWYAFGTARWEKSDPGRLNDVLANALSKPANQ
jgi:hypothetical protein